MKILKKDTTSDDAMAFVRKGKNQKMIWKKFSDPCRPEKEEVIFTYFMAGAPGSGKTEISQNNLVEILNNCIIADADEIRKLVPYYNGKNAYKTQKAASKGMDILYDGALKYGYNILIDGTLSMSYEKCEEHITRSLKRGRAVVIFYLYTHPTVAWRLSKEREYTKGRKIKIKTFIKAFYKSRDNVNRIKKKFGNHVYVVGIRSDYGLDKKIKGIGEVKANIQNVDEIQKVSYTYLSLFTRVLYANILLQKDRLLWTLKRLTKK